VELGGCGGGCGEGEQRAGDAVGEGVEEAGGRAGGGGGDERFQAAGVGPEVQRRLQQRDTGDEVGVAGRAERGEGAAEGVSDERDAPGSRAVGHGPQAVAE